MGDVDEAVSFALLNSDPNSADTDGDGVTDSEDGAPKKVNGMINYLIVGQDNDGESQVDDCADYYEELLEEGHYPYYRIDIQLATDFYRLWLRLDSYHGSLDSMDMLSRYTAVDNLIIVSHGSSSSIVFWSSDGALQGLDLSNGDPTNMKNHQRIHINTIDIQACNCANEDSDYGKYNIAYELCNNLDVDEVYAWDTECKFEGNLNYYHDLGSDGYVSYYKDGETILRNIHEDCVFKLLNFTSMYVKPKIHSCESEQ